MCFLLNTCFDFFSFLFSFVLQLWVPFHINWPWINVVSSRVWDVNTGEVLNTLIHHNEAVLHLRFSNGLMVTCSKDRSIAVWDMASPTDITLRRVLVGHRAAVNVVDFDDKYIVSASGDRTIKVSVPKRQAQKRMMENLSSIHLGPLILLWLLSPCCLNGKLSYSSI